MKTRRRRTTSLILREKSTLSLLGSGATDEGIN
jgi:hypothetical protein